MCVHVIILRKARVDGKVESLIFTVRQIYLHESVFSLPTYIHT